MNGREPIPMMDRSKAHELPQMQVSGRIGIVARNTVHSPPIKVGFMRGICIPCYEVLADVIPEAEKLRERSKLEHFLKDLKSR